MDPAPRIARRAAALAGIDPAGSHAALAPCAGKREPELPGLVAEFIQRIAGLPEPPGFGASPRAAPMETRLRRQLGRLLAGPVDDARWMDLAELAREHARAGLHFDRLLSGLRLLEARLRGLLRSEETAGRGLEELFGLCQAVMLQAHGQEREERYLRSERLAALGKVVAEVNHDLQNPLAVIRTSLFSLERRLPTPREPALQAHLDRIKRNTELAVRIASELLDLTRPRRAECVPTDLNALVRSLLEDQELGPGIEVLPELGAEVGLVPLDPIMLDRVLRNLLRNAVQAMAGRGALRLSTRRSPGGVEIRVHDSGPGFPAADLVRVFEPLFTTRPEGAGLGLTIARKLVEAHGGTIAAANPPGGGAEVTLFLPAPSP